MTMTRFRLQFLVATICTLLCSITLAQNTPRLLSARPTIVTVAYLATHTREMEGRLVSVRARLEFGWEGTTSCGMNREPPLPGLPMYAQDFGFMLIRPTNGRFLVSYLAISQRWVHSRASSISYQIRSPERTKCSILGPCSSPQSQFLTSNCQGRRCLIPDRRYRPGRTDTTPAVALRGSSTKAHFTFPTNSAEGC